MEKFGEACLTLIIAFFLFLLFAFIGAAIACWLWGIVMVGVFGLPALTYWQMYALIWLLRMLVPIRVKTTSKD